MNDNGFMNNNTPYKATRNLNTEIENPEMNVNNIVGINIQDSVSDNTNIPNNYFDDKINSNENLVNNNQVNDNIDTYFNSNESYNNIYSNLPEGYVNNNAVDNNTFITDKIDNNGNSNDSFSYDGQEEPSSSDSYHPLYKEKKKQTSFNVPTELKIMIFIVIILLVFIYIIPYLFDFLQEIKLRIFG